MKTVYKFIVLLIFFSLISFRTAANPLPNAGILLAQNDYSADARPLTYPNRQKIYGTYTRTYIQDNRKTMGTFSGKNEPGTLMLNAARPKSGYNSAVLDQYTTDKRSFNARKKQLAEEVRKHNENLDWSNRERFSGDKRVYVTYTRQNVVTGVRKYGTYIGYGNPHGIVAGNTRVAPGYYHRDANGNLVDDRNFDQPKLHTHTTDMNQFVYQANDLAEELRDNREDDNEPYLR